MVREALRNYVTLAAGLSEVTRQRAMQAARALASQGEATRDQVSSLAEDLVSTSRKNREAIATLVRLEVEKAMSRVGVATADEVAVLTRRLQRLEGALRGGSGTKKATGTKSAAKQPSRTSAKTATVKKATAKKTTPKKSGARKSTAKKAPAKKAAPATPTATTAPAATTAPSNPESPPPMRMTPESGT